MLLDEQSLLQRGRVLGSDLSRRVVDSAVRGIYGASSFRATDLAFKANYFSKVGRGLLSVDNSLRSSVSFEQANLVRLNDRGGHTEQSVIPAMDVIFCRNVLMYFDETAVKDTLRLFYSLLKKGGYLLLGHAETLLPIGTEFASVQIGRELLHRK